MVLAAINDDASLSSFETLRPVLGQLSTKVENLVELSHPIEPCKWTLDLKDIPTGRFANFTNM